MKYLTGIIATSHVDRHGDKLTIEALRSLVDQINSQYLPMTTEHDPRIPPQGRVISACLKQLQDGEYAVETETQVFEPGDDIELDTSGRKMAMRKINDEDLHIIDDRSFAFPEDQRLIEELRAIISGKKEREEKKSLLPISVLQIIGIFVLGGISNGLFNKIGADYWDAFKAKLSEVVKKKREERGQCLLTFRYIIKQNTDLVSLEVILTDPSDSDITNFLEHGIQELDKITPKLLAASPKMSKIVFKYSKGELTISFAVRVDAVPLYWEHKEKNSENK